MLFVGAFVAVITFQSVQPFQSVRHRLFDVYQTVFPRPPVAQPVWIVEIDEASLSALGQWPWPRNYLSALVDAVNDLHPAVIGLDILMPEPDHASPQAVAESRTDLPQKTIEVLKKAPSNDHLLAQSLVQSPSVLGVAGMDAATPLTQQFTSYRAPFNIVALAAHHVAISELRDYAYGLSSLPALQQAAHGQGLLSAELERGVLRKSTIVANVQNTIIPNLGLEMLRVAKHAPSIDLELNRFGAKQVRVADLRIPLQSNGEAWLYFDQAQRMRYVSALKIFNGEIDPKQFEHQMVIIGLTGLGLQDMVTTPHGDRRPGIESHVQWIEAALNHQSLLRPFWMPGLELLLFCLIAGFLITLLPTGKLTRFNWPWFPLRKPSQEISPAQAKKSKSNPQHIAQSIHYLKPGHILFWMSVVVLVLMALGFALFHWSGWLFDAINLSLGCVMVLLSLYISSHMLETIERQQTEQALFKQQLQAAKINGEMEAASKIQLGTLPIAEETFASDETRFQIAAFLTPVRHVGGDLYDFFMRDPRHVFFTIGDVSGKGMPASLLMVVTKALMKNSVLRAPPDSLQDDSPWISQIVNLVNTEMTRENPQMLFVTGIAGLLDLDTGRLAFVNYGHDAPWVIKPSGQVARVEAPSNPPLGVMDEFEFTPATYQMQAGEILYMVTDGVTEAMDSAQAFYTVERVTETLEQLSPGLSPTALVEDMKSALHDFVGAAEAADDITMLAIRWKGVNPESVMRD